MGAVAAWADTDVVQTSDERYDTVVADALNAFGTDIHYLEDMVRVAQRVIAKRAMRSRSLAVAVGSTSMV